MSATTAATDTAEFRIASHAAFVDITTPPGGLSTDPSEPFQLVPDRAGLDAGESKIGERSAVGITLRPMPHTAASPATSTRIPPTFPSSSSRSFGHLTRTGAPA